MMRVISIACALIPAPALIVWLLLQGRGNSLVRWAQSMSAGCEKATNQPPPNMELATFGGGCFWGLELKFQRVPGVHKTSVGYANGQTDNPTYEAVCSGQTGYTEAVQVGRGAVADVSSACTCALGGHLRFKHPLCRGRHV